MLLELKSIIIEESGTILAHVLHLFILLLLVSLFIFVRRTKKQWNKINDYISSLTKTVNSIRYGDLTKKLDDMDLPNSEILSDSVNRMIESLHDRESMITEYQSELSKQNQFLEAAINSLSDGLIITDENDKIQRATLRISEWFKVPGKDLIGKSLTDFIEIPKRKTVETLKDDEVTVIADPASSFLANSVELKLDESQKRFIVILKNNTNQKELETLKEDFVATLTHDLKVPIIAETNMIELFLNENFGPISEKQKQALKNMQTSNKELLDLVQIVLETYKIKDGKINLHKENIMLKGFIEEIIEEMTPIAQKTENEIKFILNRDIRVLADRFQLKRVVKNLIQNAISYGSPKSPVEISIGEIPKYIIIKIKDYGAGISKDDLNKIFNKYYSAAKKFRKIGTGLGLYLALQISKAHNGDLTVDSVEGEYTEFCIKLPA